MWDPERRKTDERKQGGTEGGKKKKGERKRGKERHIEKEIIHSQLRAIILGSDKLVLKREG